MEDFVETVLSIIGIYSLVLIVFGTLMNTFSMCVCLRKNLRKVPTFTFYFFLLASDSLALYVWNLDHYLLKFHNYQLEDLGVHMCRFVTLWQLFAFQCSAWLLVAMIIERYLSVKIKTWRLRFKPKIALIVILCIHVVILLLNIKFAIAIEYGENFESNITCFGADSYGVYMQQNNITYCFIPFLTMTLTNLLLYFELNCKKQDSTHVIVTSSQNKLKRKAISYTVLLLSTMFMLLTGPDAIANAFYVPYLFETRERIAILFFLDSIAFTFHSFNFAALLLTNKQFHREFRSLVAIFRKNTITAVHPTSSSINGHATQTRRATSN